MGSCALIALLRGNKIYAANSGDCKGLIIKNNGQTEKINHKLNANSKKE